jgi:hypothetical protein
VAFVFRPAVLRGGVLFELPRPVLSLRAQDAWDFEQFKVPLLPGDFTAGHSRSGVDLSVEGQIGSHAGALRTSEEQMLATLESLRGALDVAGTDEKYTFFLYHDVTSGTYRSFKRCSTVRLDYDLSNVHLFSWSAVIHADDPVLYSSAP